MSTWIIFLICGILQKYDGFLLTLTGRKRMSEEWNLQDVENRLAMSLEVNQCGSHNRKKDAIYVTSFFT
ncbi:MAG: hypothetical protein LBH80_00755 [Prevotellaceae bacterium]|nr:hypothetical protein [Prevotellaceae bacterium]